MRIVTSVFQMTKGMFLREMLKLYGIPWIVVMSLMLIATGVLGFVHDMRWLVVALMIFFLFVPMWMAFFYIYHGFRPVTVLNVLPHTLKVTSDEILVEVYVAASHDEGSEPDVRRFQISMSDISGIAPGLTSVIIFLKNRKKGFLWLPVSALENANVLKETLDVIGRNLKN